MRLTTLARNLRTDQTDAEKVLWYQFRSRRFFGLKFRRQHPIKNYIADFCCVEKMLVIEVDGGQHQLQRETDLIRTIELRRLGYSVMRFWNHEVLNDLESVLESIRLGILPLTPPSPKGRGKRTV